MKDVMGADAGDGGTAGGRGGDGRDGGELGELMHGAFRRLRRRWSEQLAPLGLTPHQSRALAAVERGGEARQDPGAVCPGVRLKDLAELLRIAPRSATEVVDQLAEKGLVERTPDPADRRATRILLTERGVSLRGEVAQVRRQEADDFFAVLNLQDQAELARILQQLI